MAGSSQRIQCLASALAASATSAIGGAAPIGVGGTKMKIHKAAIRQLFAANDVILDAPEIYELGKQLT